MKDFIIKIMPSILVRTFARPYVSGNSILKGISRAEELWETEKISSTMDLLGEAVNSKEEVNRNIETYLKVLDLVKGKKYISVSLKPSSLGSHVSLEYLESNLRKILDKALQNDIRISLDMEDHNFTDLTLTVYKKLIKDYQNFGTVLQSRLFRTEKDIEGLKGFKGRIRTCIGIYKEDKSIAIQNKPEMKEKLLEYATKLYLDGNFIEFATHDQNTIRTFLKKIDENNWDKSRIEFQMLMGVPMKKIQRELISEGYTVRLYVPFATDWKFAIPYLKRRLNNNPKMAIYVIQHLFSRDA